MNAFGSLLHCEELIIQVHVHNTSIIAGLYDYNQTCYINTFMYMYMYILCTSRCTYFVRVDVYSRYMPSNHIGGKQTDA